MVWSKVRIRLAELAVATILAGATIWGVTTARDFRRDAVPASEWFAIKEVFVPDHVMGEDPQMIYDREILQPFRGFWIVEVQERSAGTLSYTACTGSGVNDYDLDDHLPGDTVDLSWFVGRECKLAPGAYRLRVSIDKSRPGWPVKHTLAYSNLFTVSP